MMMGSIMQVDLILPAKAASGRSPNRIDDHHAGVFVFRQLAKQFDIIGVVQIPPPVRVGGQGVEPDGLGRQSERGGPLFQFILMPIATNPECGSPLGECLGLTVWPRFPKPDQPCEIKRQMRLADLGIG